MDSRDTPRASRTPLLPRTPMPPPSPRLPQTPQTKRPVPIGGEKTPTPHHSASRQRMRHSIPHRWDSPHWSAVYNKWKRGCSGLLIFSVLSVFWIFVIRTCSNLKEYFNAGGWQGCRCMVEGVLDAWAASPLPAVLLSVKSVGQQHISNAPRNCHPLVDCPCNLLNISQKTGLHTPLRKDQVPQMIPTMYCKGGSRCQGKKVVLLIWSAIFL